MQAAATILTPQAQQQAAAGQPAGRQMVTLRQMAGATLGRAGGAAASATYLLLSFSLLTAYIAKVGRARMPDSMDTYLPPLPSTLRQWAAS